MAFQSIRKFYKNMGLYPLQTHQKFQFNWRIFSILLAFSLTFVSLTGTFLYKASTVTEYAESFYLSLTVLACTIIFLISFWQTKNIYTFIEKLEKFSENRKSTKNCKIPYSNKSRNKKKILMSICRNFYCRGLR